MRYCGYSEYFHDAGLAFVKENGEIEYATHAERHTKRKFENTIPEEMWRMVKPSDHVTFYEDHRIRRERYMDVDMEFNSECIPPMHKNVMLDALVFDDFITHHTSHAAMGYHTRPWDSQEDTVILSVDGVGEKQSTVIFDHNMKELESWNVPLSLGLLYAQTTKAIGLRPLEDDYVVMGMSAYGEPTYAEDIMSHYKRLQEMTKTRTLFDKSHLNHFIKKLAKKCSQEDLAASVQVFAENLFMELARICRKYGSKLIVTGGCAQNIIAMTKIKESGLFEDMHIAVAPTDAGSALGAAAYTYCKQTGESKIKWKDAYLGTDMGCTINPKEVVDHLLEYEYCGIASGRAEFGPRALGNRSLIADVRRDVKDTVNRIKRRQEYRPFAPAILEEFASDYFEGQMNEYMQYQATAKHDHKSVTHVDGTARVQLVSKDCTSIFRKVIEEYYDRTGVPMLLNTSLNIRGKPMVDDHEDAKLFEQHYNVKVFT